MEAENKSLVGMGVPFSESAFCIQRKALESQGKVWACLEFGLHLCYWAGSVSHYKNAKYLSKCGFPCQGAIPKKPRGSEVGLATPCLCTTFLVCSRFLLRLLSKDFFWLLCHAPSVFVCVYLWCLLLKATLWLLF